MTPKHKPDTAKKEKNAKPKKTEFKLPFKLIVVIMADHTSKVK